MFDETRRVTVENRQHQNHRHKRNQVGADSPKEKKFFRQTEYPHKCFHDQVAEYGNAERRQHRADNQQGEQDRFRFDANIGLDIFARLKRDIGRADQGVDAFG